MHLTEVAFWHDYHAARDILWRLLLERPPTANISHTKMPTWAEHCRYVDSNPYRVWCIATVDDHPVGAVSATDANELGVAIFQRFARHGYATQALLELMRQWQPLPAERGKRHGSWIANIAPTNGASIALFTKALGAVEIQRTYRVPSPEGGSRDNQQPNP